jgi:hypothetical protein
MGPRAARRVPLTCLKFIEMATDPEYLKIHAHREAALADSRLLACAELVGPSSLDAR